MNLKKYLPWLVALLYFLNPYDVIPDFALGVGWLDDLAVACLVLWWVSRLKRTQGQGTASSAHIGADQNSADDGAPAEEDPYRTLGLQPGATKEDIKTAFKRQAAQYHPDKVQHLGKEFQDLAHKKFVAIQKAYDTLMKA
jgi:predicted lipid-binding transport protein (Tim44 family)